MKRTISSILAIVTSATLANASQQPSETEAKCGPGGIFPSNNWVKCVQNIGQEKAERDLYTTRRALEALLSVKSVPAKFRVIPECERVKASFQDGGIAGFFDLAHAYPEIVIECVNAPEIQSW
ncbi:MAG: hypothetical protein ACSHWZ_19210 [Sulfitobacter sp.]